MKTKRQIAREALDRYDSEFIEFEKRCTERGMSTEDMESYLDFLTALATGKMFHEICPEWWDGFEEN